MLKTLAIISSILTTLATVTTSINEILDECNPLVIAHRGASGYVPEHTLGAYALAITMGADYIEPDLVMTRDGHLIARHENQLGLSTDVADHPEFATRYRTQTVDRSTLSGWFSEDFTLQELKTLRARELIPNVRPGNTRMDNSFQVPTLQEIIDLLKGMEASEHRVIGVYPEIKHPTHFQRIGLAMERPLVDLLHQNGYQDPNAPVYIQSFEVSNLQELKNITDLRLLQLFGGNQANGPFDQYVIDSGLTYGAMATAEGLREVASYAYAVGPDKSYVIPRDSQNRLGIPTTFVANAHAAGLKVHPYTFRAENTYLPVEFRSADLQNYSYGNLRGEIQAFLAEGIDGLFIDQPDVLAAIRSACVNIPSGSSEFVGWNVLFIVIVALFAYLM